MKSCDNLNEASVLFFYNLESANKKIGRVNENIINSSTYKIQGAMPYDKFTFNKDTNLASNTEYQKRTNGKLRLSLLQQLNQALDKGVIEFVEIISHSQIPKESLKNKQTQIRSFKVVKMLTNFFSLTKNNYENGSKNCTNEFNFYSDNRL